MGIPERSWRNLLFIPADPSQAGNPLNSHGRKAGGARKGWWETELEAPAGPLAQNIRCATTSGSVHGLPPLCSQLALQPKEEPDRWGSRSGRKGGLGTLRTRRGSAWRRVQASSPLQRPEPQGGGGCGWLGPSTCARAVPGSLPRSPAARGRGDAAPGERAPLQLRSARPPGRRLPPSGSPTPAARSAPVT